MNSTPTIRVEMQDGLAVVSLAQPGRGNPIGFVEIQGLKEWYTVNGIARDRRRSPMSRQHDAKSTMERRIRRRLTHPP